MPRAMLDIGEPCRWKRQLGHLNHGLLLAPQEQALALPCRCNLWQLAASAQESTSEPAQLCQPKCATKPASLQTAGTAETARTTRKICGVRTSHHLVKSWSDHYSQNFHG